MTFNTLYEIVKHSVEKFANRIAFSMIGGEDVSYKEVGERVDKVQEMLLNAGVGAGDKVVILSSSMPNWSVSYFAVTSAGMVTAKNTGTVEITATSAATAQYNAAPSKTVTIKVLPAVTSSLTASNQETGIKLTWKKAVGATGYKIYRNSTLIKTITGDSTVTYVDTKANTNMTRYIYKVAVKGPDGDSPLARSVTAYRVDRPVLSSVTNSAASVITAKWTAIPRVNGYQIKYSTSKTFASGNGTVSANNWTANTKLIGKLTKGKTWYVKIRAYKLVGNGVYWSEWSPVRTVRISK